jgi:ferrous iron transport protein B
MNIIALVGNPNSGKSSLFNHLTGLRQKVANFPGVTVDKKFGTFRLPDGGKVQVIDLPGAYSLYPSSQDELMSLEVLANPADEIYPDAVVYVADVTHLEKHLLLLSQIIDLGFPVILALNMSDLAEKEGIQVDTRQISAYLGVPVVSVSGRQGSNVAALRQEIASLLKEKKPAQRAPVFHFYSEEEKEVVAEIRASLNIANPYHALLLAHHHSRLTFLKNEKKAQIAAICQAAGFKDLPLQIAETMGRFGAYGPVLKRAVRKAGEKQTLTDKLDAIFTHKIFAPLLFFAIMFLVFQAIFAWAVYPMNWIDQGFISAGDFFNKILPPGWFTSLLTEGILSGLGGVLIFVPQIAILFFLITLLEEVGYMARAVFIFDKLMQQFGLNGRSVVALISGGACAIPAIMSTRTISNWKERLITILVTPLISCSARIPVYTVLIGFAVPADTVFGVFNLQGLAFMGLYLLGIVAALASAYVFKKILKSKERSWLMLELPPYRAPVWGNVWLTIREKVGAFVLEAGKVIMVVSVILWGLATYGPPEKMEMAEKEALALAQERSLDETATANLVASRKIEMSYAGHLGKFIEPAIEPLGFDWKIGIALITSFAAREVFVATMATLYSIGSSDDEATIHNRLAEARHPDSGAMVYTVATSASLLIFYVFAMQCMSTMAVVRRETGSWKWVLVQFGYMSGLAYLGSLTVFQLLN